jgi:predicted flavoprotein YhiN
MRSTLASRIEKRNSSTETSLEDLKHQLEILSAQQQSVPESESGTGGVGVRSISQEVRGTWCPQLYFRHLIQLRILKTFKT